MGPTIRAEFSATLSKSRPSVLYGNTKLYSLNQNFSIDGYMWKFIITPINEIMDVSGFIEKVNAVQSIPFTTEEAENAVKEVFLAVGNVEVLPQITSPISFCTFISSDIAFSLRVQKSSNSASGNELQQYASKPIILDQLPQLLTISTSPIHHMTAVDNVFGLLRFQTFPGQVYSLEYCAELLAKYFPRHLITWLSYCTKVEAWKMFQRIL